MVPLQEISALRPSTSAQGRDSFDQCFSGTLPSISAAVLRMRASEARRS